MTLTEQQVREILAGCEKATPGPWTACLHVGIPDAHIRAEIHGCNICDVIEGTESARGGVSHEDMQANTQHIARLDPQTVTALFEELLSRRAADAAVRDALENWSRADHLQLHAGEMTAQELRTTKAVVKAISAEILALKSKASP